LLESDAFADADFILNDVRQQKRRFPAIARQGEIR